MNASLDDSEPSCLEVFNLVMSSNGDRLLFDNLSMSLGNDHVALVGRNGAGKTTLLELLAGRLSPDRGTIRWRGTHILVPQIIGEIDMTATFEWLRESGSTPALELEFSTAGLRRCGEYIDDRAVSRGELRKLALIRAKFSGAGALLLDEPSEDLDEAGAAWLRRWLAEWTGAMLVCSHDESLLSVFRNFFVVGETGCRYFSGSIEELVSSLELEHRTSELRYLRGLNRLRAYEEHVDHTARRRRRKKQFGRVRELGRATPRQRLNQKRDYAQVKHGRMKRVREARLEEQRHSTKLRRRSIGVELPMVIPEITLPPNEDRILLTAEGLSARSGGEYLFSDINLAIRRDRLAVVGPNGSGKTTLLEMLLGRVAPATGVVVRDIERIGSITQGGRDWMLDCSLLALLWERSNILSPEDLATLCLTHRFPLALAQRPLRTLSPGERVRAALLCLLHREPVPELLVLDEPTFSLDLVGRRALRTALATWRGGLIVASHDTTFLDGLGMESYVRLGSTESV